MKKGEMEWEEMGKLLIGIVLMGILILVIVLFKDKMGDLLDKAISIFRFGV